MEITENIHETNGRSVTVALPETLERPMNFDHENTRRDLIAMRVKFGAKSAKGHRCSNLVELLDNYGKAESEEQRAHIEKNIRKQMAELAELTKGN